MLLYIFHGDLVELGFKTKLQKKFIFEYSEFNFMERPVIKDKEVLAYIEEMERQLKNFKSDNAVAKMYLSKLNWVDYIVGIQNDLTNDAKKEAEQIDSEDYEEDLDDNDYGYQEMKRRAAEKKSEMKARSIDRMLDRCLKIQEGILKTATDLKELEKLTNPDSLNSVKKEMGSAFERGLNMIKK